VAVAVAVAVPAPGCAGKADRNAIEQLDPRVRRSIR
jgi:hypothetical protein